MQVNKVNYEDILETYKTIVGIRPNACKPILLLSSSFFAEKHVAVFHLP